MASEIDICNLALSNIRGGEINSLSESSVQARQCALRYPMLRDMMLKDSPWNFAHGIKALALLTSVPLQGWKFTYTYPADCEEINRIMMPEDGVPDSRFVPSDFNGVVIPIQQIPYKVYNVNGVRVIGCNQEKVHIDYRMKITNTSLFSSTFVLALSQLLAAEIAVAIVGAEQGLRLRDAAYTAYLEYLSAAVSSDMNEEYTPDADSAFIISRL